MNSCQIHSQPFLATPVIAASQRRTTRLETKATMNAIEMKYQAMNALPARGRRKCWPDNLQSANHRPMLRGKSSPRYRQPGDAECEERERRGFGDWGERRCGQLIKEHRESSNVTDKRRRAGGR